MAGVAAAKVAVQDLAIDATLTRQGAAVQIPGQAPEYPQDDYEVKVVLTSYKASEIDGDRILASDVLGLIFPETDVPVPQPNDFLAIGEISYRIIYNDKIMAGDTVALSQVQLRLK